MLLNNKKLSQNLIIIIILIVVCSWLAWFYAPQIKKLLFGTEYQPITSPFLSTTVDKNLKQEIISQLEKLKQYGEWPMVISSENPFRGDPFSPKK